jgi:hypothetical protein
LRKRTNSIFKIDLKRILEYTIEELISTNYTLLHGRLKAEIERLKREYQMLKMELDEISKQREKLYDEDYIRERGKTLENIQKRMETLKKVRDKIEILGTISDIEREYSSRDKELWNNIKQIKLNAILNYEGNVEDRNAVYNFLINIVKGFQPEKLPEKRMIELPKALPEERVPRKEPEQPVEAIEVVNIGEKEYVDMKIGEWVQLFNKCFDENKQIKLPDNFLSENLRRPLRNLIAALLEIPPEKAKHILPKDYKFLLLVNDIFYNLIKDNKKYEVTPSSSEKGYIEEVFDIFQAEEVETRKIDENIIRKTYSIKIGEQEYKIMKETLLERGRAKLIRYILTK